MVSKKTNTARSTLRAVAATRHLFCVRAAVSLERFYIVLINDGPKFQIKSKHPDWRATLLPSAIKIRPEPLRLVETYNVSRRVIIIILINKYKYILFYSRAIARRGTHNNIIQYGHKSRGDYCLIIAILLCANNN